MLVLVVATVIIELQYPPFQDSGSLLDIPYTRAMEKLGVPVSQSGGDVSWDRAGYLLTWRLTAKYHRSPVDASDIAESMTLCPRLKLFQAGGTMLCTFSVGAKVYISGQLSE